jgi:hypothetical protein
LQKGIAEGAYDESTAQARIIGIGASMLFESGQKRKD